MEDKIHNTGYVGNEIIIYQTEGGQTKIDVKFEDKTVWLTQAQLCELYQTSKSNISEHSKHIFEEGALEDVYKRQGTGLIPVINVRTASAAAGDSIGWFFWIKPFVNLTYFSSTDI